MANVFHDVFQLILNNLYLIGVLALSTMGITLTYKTTNVANFSQAITSTIYTPQEARSISFEAKGMAILDVEKYDLELS